ncbi:MAG TPA: hypothetical protein DCM45_05815, partial [Clostridiales bacterium]|nr:hypothetical protein [Clostridiales bacterium]
VCLLSRWCQVREDLMFAFEKSLETGLDDPMQQAIRELLTRVRGGMPPDRALDLIQKQIRHENFTDLITAIRFNFRHRGNLTDLLEQLEIQLHRIEEEHDRRRLSNARDVTLTMLILLAVPILFIFRLAGSATVRELFFTDNLGQIAMITSLAVYLIAITAFLLIKRKISG